MFEIRNDVPAPIPQRELCLKHAQWLLDKGGISKSFAARRTLNDVDNDCWIAVTKSKIDFIRQRLEY